MYTINKPILTQVAKDLYTLAVNREHAIAKAIRYQLPEDHELLKEKDDFVLLKRFLKGYEDYKMDTSLTKSKELKNQKNVAHKIYGRYTIFDEDGNKIIEDAKITDDMRQVAHNIEGKIGEWDQHRLQALVDEEAGRYILNDLVKKKFNGAFTVDKGDKWQYDYTIILNDPIPIEKRDENGDIHLYGELQNGWHFDYKDNLSNFHIGDSDIHFTVDDITTNVYDYVAAETLKRHVMDYYPTYISTNGGVLLSSEMLSNPDDIYIKNFSPKDIDKQAEDIYQKYKNEIISRDEVANQLRNIGNLNFLMIPEIKDTIKKYMFKTSLWYGKSKK